MIYKVQLSSHAVREYRKLDPTLRPDIDKAFVALQHSPLQGAKIKRLKGRLRDYFRYRVAGYRIVYAVDSKMHAVFVDFIQHRKDVYR